MDSSFLLQTDDGIPLDHGVPLDHGIPPDDGCTTMRNIPLIQIYMPDGSTIYECPIRNCGKRYPSMSGTRQHIRNIHERDTEYICQFCDKQFSNRGTLRNHKITQHNADSNLRCPFCNMTFVARRTMEYHAVECQRKRVMKRSTKD